MTQMIVSKPICTHLYLYLVNKLVFSIRDVHSDLPELKIFLKKTTNLYFGENISTSQRYLDFFGGENIKKNPPPKLWI